MWDVVLDKVGTHLNPKAKAILSRYKEQYDQLNTNLLKNDGCGVAKVFQNFLIVKNTIFPLIQDRDFMKACDIYQNDFDYAVMLDQCICRQNHDNVTLLQTLNDYLKPLANGLYHISDTYQPKTIDKCQGRN